MDGLVKYVRWSHAAIFRTMNKNQKQWLLPEGISEVETAKAALLEAQRRLLLDYYSSWGYELVMTPFVEYLDSLLVGTAKDLALQTFTLTDQISGRLLGLRADITPQAARIDARKTDGDMPTRLCYIGTVLRSQTDGFGSSRSPLQIGAELYGHHGIESDIEIISLMLETLNLNQVPDVSIDLGHVGIFRGLAKQAGLSEEQESLLFEALQRKAIPEIDQLIVDFGLQSPVAEMIGSLAHLNGGDEVAQLAKQNLQAASDEVQTAVEDVVKVATAIGQRYPDLCIHYDLAELRAYHYQTGIVFAAFKAEMGQEIARGGRYDNIGEEYGRARPATGFSADLKKLLEIGELDCLPASSKIFAPAEDDEDLNRKIKELRGKGEIVIQGLPGQAGGAEEMGCDKILSKDSGVWTVLDQ